MSEEVNEEVQEEVVDTGVEYSEQEYIDMLSNEGTFTEEWRNSLPDDLGKHSIWSKYTTPEDLAKGAIHAQGFTGKKLQELMESDDPAIIEQRKEIFNVPDAADDYSIEFPEAPEGFEADDEAIGEFKEVAHAMGLSNDQAQALVEYELARNELSEKEEEKEYEMLAMEAEQDLREEWRGDEYEYNISRVAECLDFLGLSELKDDPQLGNNTAFIKAINDKIVPLIKDDAIIANKNESIATVDDQLVELESKMYSHENTNDLTYQQLTKEYGQLLSKKASLNPPANLL